MNSTLFNTTTAASTLVSTTSARNITTTTSTIIVSTIQTLTSTMATNISSPTLMPIQNNSGNGVTSDSCDSFTVELPSDIGLSIIFGISFMLGIFFALFGYRIFRAACFVQSLALFGTIMHIVLLKTTTLSLVINGVIAAAVGSVFGSASAFLLPVGIVFLSLSQAIFVAGSILVVVDLFHFIDYIWIPLGMVGGLFIILVAICFSYQRPAMIVYITSFSGVLAMSSVDFYINKFQMTSHAYHMLLANFSHLSCWYSYLIYILWPVVMVIGCSVQLVKTAKGFHHKREQSPSLKKKKSPSLHRGLYYNGDIIAQAWIQDAEDTLEKRCSYMQPFEECYPEPGESTTLV